MAEHRNCHRPDSVPPAYRAKSGQRWRCTVCNREWVRSDDDLTQTGPQAVMSRAGKRGWKPTEPAA